MEVCIRCNGKGTYMGNGFITTDCELCNGDTAPFKHCAPPIDKIDRRSKAYNDAIKDIMLENKLSRAEAVKMFDEAY